MAVNLSDIRFGRSNGDFVISLSRTQDFDNCVTLSTSTPDTPEGFRFKPSVQWKAKTGNLQIREYWQQIEDGCEVGNSGVAASLIILKESYRVLFYDFLTNEDEEDKPKTSDFKILIEILENHQLPPPNFQYETTASGQFSDLTLYRHKEEVRETRFVRMIFYQVADNRFLDVNHIRSIMTGLTVLQPKEMAASLISLWRVAVHQEAQFKKRQLRLLARKDCHVRIEKKHGSMNKMTIKIRSNQFNDDWKLETGQKLHLFAPPLFPSNATYPLDDGCRDWVATVMPSSGEFYTAVVANQIDENHDWMFGEEYVRVEVTVSTLDSLTDRFLTAARILASTMAKERGEAVDDGQVCRRVSLRVPISRLLLVHPTYDVSKWENMPLRLNHGEKLRVPLAWDLQPSHIQFLKKVFIGKGGVTAAVGPPGTGKTTLLAKTAVILSQHARLDLPIVMTAHSNQAVVVLLQKLVEQYQKINGSSPKDEIVWVETMTARQRRVDFARNTPKELEVYNLQDRCFALAMENMDRYMSYLQYLLRAQEGRAIPPSIVKEFKEQQGQLFEIIRARASIYVCTLTTCADHFFTRGDKLGVFPCDIFMVDEASQPHWLECIEAQQIFNPYRIVYAGDDKQLHPMLHSDEAIMAWSKSPIQCIRERSPALSVLFDVQFRMPQTLYAPTSIVHYAGQISSFPPPSGRAESKELLDKLRRIWVDPLGNGHWFYLGNNLIVFDVQFGTQTSAPNTSQHNLSEIEVIRYFCAALLKAGFTEKEIMLLTGYSGQFRQLDGIRQEHPQKAIAARKINSSQGDERDVVILSTVVTHTIGFMDQARRQNVATSRQKDALFVFCRRSLLERSTQAPVWRQWFRAVEKSQGENHWQYYVQKNFRFRVDGQIVTLSRKVDINDTAPNPLATNFNPVLENVTQLESAIENRMLIDFDDVQRPLNPANTLSITESAAPLPTPAAATDLSSNSTAQELAAASGGTNNICNLTDADRSKREFENLVKEWDDRDRRLADDLRTKLFNCWSIESMPRRCMEVGKVAVRAGADLPTRKVDAVIEHVFSRVEDCSE